MTFTELLVYQFTVHFLMDAQDSVTNMGTTGQKSTTESDILSKIYLYMYATPHIMFELRLRSCNEEQLCVSFILKNLAWKGKERFLSNYVCMFRDARFTPSTMATNKQIMS